MLSVLSCAYLIFGLPNATYLMFLVWIALALIVYFTYSVHHSRLAAEPGDDERAT